MGQIQLASGLHGVQLQEARALFFERGELPAGGFVGFVAAHPQEEITHELLTRAMAYGTAVASFNVEEFGTDRVARLTPGEIAERVAALQAMTTFSDVPISLRG